MTELINDSNHLYRLSTSSPDPPPSPSSASAVSSLSSTTPAGSRPAAPITLQAVLSANVFLELLRSDELTVTLNEVKDRLGNVASVKGWNGIEGEITKVVYQLIGKKTLKIDRRGKAGGFLSFQGQAL
jgi:hypothetical protein